MSLNWRACLAVVCFFVVFSFASCKCSDDTRTFAPPWTTSIGGQGGSTVSSSGGYGGGGALGGGGESPCVHPSIMAQAILNIPMVQGVSFTLIDSSDVPTANCNGTCVDQGGAGGTEITDCPSSYKPLVPQNCFSSMPETTNVRLAMVSPPVFEPYLDENICTAKAKPIFPGAVYLADCQGDVNQVFAFEDANLTTLIGFQTVFPSKINLTINSHPISILAGLTIETAVCGDRLYLLTNASSKIVEVDISEGGGNARVDLETGEQGLSALLCGQNGSVIYSTQRAFTTSSFQEAVTAGDAGLLVESRPVSIVSFDLLTQQSTVIATVAGGSRVLASRVVTMAGGDIFMAGSVNHLAYDDTGNILLGDHLEGTLWLISPDGSTQEALFTSERLFTSFARATDGSFYLGLNPMGNFQDHVMSRPIIARYNPQGGQVEDWFVTSGPEYDEWLPQIILEAVMVERDYANYRIYLGGNFADLVPNQNNDLFLGETLRNVVDLVRDECAKE